MDLNVRVEAVCASPIGCAYLLVVEEHDLAPEVAAHPVVAIHAAAVAVNAVDQWKVAHDAIVAVALENGPRLAGLARNILAQPAAAWWFAPLDRTAQWVILRPNEVVAPDDFLTPTSPPTPWDLYAQ